jgi:hypothetical protein
VHRVPGEQLGDPSLAQVPGLRESREEPSPWLEALAAVGEFEHLDAYQLVKHYLGLTNTFKETPSVLVYLYWEPENATECGVFERHRAEITHFAELVAEDPACRFTALSYREHWGELERLSDAPTWLSSHLKALRVRYVVEI